MLTDFSQGALESSTPEHQLAIDQAHQQFPILNDLGLKYRTGAGAPGEMLEFWRPGEPGEPHRPRPTEFPLNSPGVELFSDKVRPIDILGDVVSHHLKDADPKIAQTYSAFEKSITPEQEGLLRRQYQTERDTFGEKRDFEAWKEHSGLPAFFRGHPFQQWPAEFNQQVYTPQQIQLLDKMMEYLGGKNAEQR